MRVISRETGIARIDPRQRPAKWPKAFYLSDLPHCRICTGSRAGPEYLEHDRLPVHPGQVRAPGGFGRVRQWTSGEPAEPLHRTVERILPEDSTVFGQGPIPTGVRRDPEERFEAFFTKLITRHGRSIDRSIENPSAIADVE